MIGGLRSGLFVLVFHVNVNLASHAILVGAVLNNLCVLDVYNQ